MNSTTDMDSLPKFEFGRLSTLRGFSYCWRSSEVENKKDITAATLSLKLSSVFILDVKTAQGIGNCVKKKQKTKRDPANTFPSS